MPASIPSVVTVGIAVPTGLSQTGTTDIFAGQTVTAGSTLAMYTYGGDINLDGVIDPSDYGVAAG
jgi:hypothetical protein